MYMIYSLCIQDQKTNCASVGKRPILLSLDLSIIKLISPEHLLAHSDKTPIKSINIAFKFRLLKHIALSQVAYELTLLYPAPLPQGIRHLSAEASLNFDSDA